jgi:hypothetical protein
MCKILRFKKGRPKTSIYILHDLPLYSVISFQCQTSDLILGIDTGKESNDLLRRSHWHTKAAYYSINSENINAKTN